MLLLFGRRSEVIVWVTPPLTALKIHPVPKTNLPAFFKGQWIKIAKTKRSFQMLMWLLRIIASSLDMAYLHSCQDWHSPLGRGGGKGREIIEVWLVMIYALDKALIRNIYIFYFRNPSRRWKLVIIRALWKWVTLCQIATEAISVRMGGTAFSGWLMHDE